MHEIAQTPCCPLHAVLGRPVELATGTGLAFQAHQDSTLPTTSGLGLEDLPKADSAEPINRTGEGGLRSYRFRPSLNRIALHSLRPALKSIGDGCLEQVAGNGLPPMRTCDEKTDDGPSRFFIHGPEVTRAL